MSLKKAIDYYNGPARTYNPLWTHIFRAFRETLLRDCDGHPGLYVERREGQGVTPEDIRDYLRSCPGRLYTVKGPAGLGKTTFLRHTLSTPDATRFIAWIDVDRDAAELNSTAVVSQVQREIASQYNQHFRTDDARLERWHRFFLGNCRDADGGAHLLLEEWKNFGELSRENMQELRGLLRQAGEDLLELLRLMFAFTKDGLGQTPCVVIDNVDQLPSKSLEDLRDYASQLARGTSRGASRAAIVMGMRPISLGRIYQGTTVGLVGVLSPPDIGEVITRRLNVFFEEFRGRVARGTLLADQSRHTVDLREVVGAGLVELPPNQLAAEMIRALALVMTADSTPFRRRVMPLVHKLTNRNTRLCLVATVQYLASGHLDWRRLVATVARKEEPKLSYRKTLMAVFLGVNTVYRTQTTWLFNVFHDGKRDHRGILIRIRMLRAVENGGAEEGVARTRLFDVFTTTLGAPGDRVEATWENIHDAGLIEEFKAGRFRLTDGGKTYLTTMVTDFEYLQHVAIDTCVDARNLVRCTRADEHVTRRYERVLGLGRCIREQEVEDLADVLTRRAHKSYHAWFGDDLVCNAIARALTESARHLPHPGSAERDWVRLDEEVAALRKAAAYDIVLHEAGERARRQLTDLAASITE